MKQKIQIISNIVIVMALAAVAYHFNEKYSELNEANKQQELQNTALQVKYSDSKQRIETLEETITDLQNGVVRLAEVDRLKIKSIRVEDFALVSKNGKELITMKSYPNRTFMSSKVKTDQTVFTSTSTMTEKKASHSETTKQKRKLALKPMKRVSQLSQCGEEANTFSEAVKGTMK